MKADYRRDFNHNYMILEGSEITGEEYPVRMLEQNQIPELLKFQLRRLNGKCYFYYEITSKQPVSQIYENGNMSSKDIRKLLLGIQNGINRAHQYLLSSEELLLTPENIYMNIETGEVQLCYVPFLEEREQKTIVNLAEFLLKKLNHGDRQAVELGYGLFGQVSQENFSMQECFRTLLREASGGEEQQSNSWEQTEVQKEEQCEKKRVKREYFLEGLDSRKEVEGNQKIQTKKEKLEGRKAWKGEKNKKSKQKPRSEIRTESGKKNKKWMIFAAIFLAAGVLFAGIVYFGRLDLTQIGGLAFLFLAVFWIGCSIWESKKEKKKSSWLEDVDDEEEFSDEFLQEVYYVSEAEREEQMPREDPAEICGETRCLAASEYEPRLRLCSLHKSEYPDMEWKKEKLLLGKKRDQVDVCLPQEEISRIHAKLEKEGEEYFVTDLNSTNGTFVNGERLSPNEKRKILPGDKLCFATLRYLVQKG